ncbi:hypothetical protein HDE_10777 [Halotydeus destructor]|nr:hypothetical protein HDE_10777 [Halotydeus destructor]
MFKLAVYLLLVTWWVPTTEGTLLADIFDLVGTLLHLLGHAQSQGDDSSSGRKEEEPVSIEEKDLRNCLNSTSPDFTRPIIQGCVRRSCSLSHTLTFASLSTELL